MKESEKLKLELERTDCDFKAMAIRNKLVGVERLEQFEFRWLPRLKANFPVDNSIPYRFTIDTETHGKIDFYPKANNLLIRRTNTWKKPGLKWIVEKLLK